MGSVGLGDSDPDAERGVVKADDKDPAYLEWLHGLTCMVCNRRPVEAHHYGPRGYGTKAPDRRAIPLCVEHHQWPHKEAAHTLGKQWAEHHGIDVEDRIKKLQARYRYEHERK